MKIKWQKMKIKYPFGVIKKRDGGQEKTECIEDDQEVRKEGQKRQSLIDSIKIPLVSVLPRTFTRGSEEKVSGQSPERKCRAVPGST